jgi:pimeloyl-ACP methyl ester carboxylesterase
MSNFRSNVQEKVLPASNNSKLVEAYLMEQYYGHMSKKEFIGRFDIVLEKLDLKKSLASDTIPKLIIESDNDPLVPPILREKMKMQYPEAEVVTFQSTGHFTYLNEPEMYLQHLRSFF